MNPCPMMSESELQEAVAEYLVRQYPDVMFHSDFGSGVKLTPAQATRQKRQNGYRKGWPDVFIAESTIQEKDESGKWHFKCLCRDFDRSINTALCGSWSGLFLELKKEGTRLKKKNGDWATEHIAEQAEVLEGLRQRGYCAGFAVGFEEAKRIIDDYLGGESEEN